MKRFQIDRLKESDIIAGRNLVSEQGKLIRDIIGSDTNHNALVINHRHHGLGIGDMFPPCGVFVPFSHYENLVEGGKYDLRVFRVIDATNGERCRISYEWQILAEDQPYSEYALYRLWVFRIVNSLPYHIHGRWCTRIIGDIFKVVFPPQRNIFRKIYEPGMPLKKNETPRTVEKRLVQGLLEDVTEEVFR